MDTHEQVKLLHSEIVKSVTNRLSLVNLLYLSVATSSAFAFSTNNGFIVLSAYSIVIPIYFLVLNITHNICKTSTYLYVFVGAKIYPWENRLHNLNKNTKKAIRRYGNSYKFPFLFLNIFIVLVFILNTDLCQPISIVVLSVLIVVCILFAILIVSTKDVEKLKDLYIEEWNKIKIQEDNVKLKI